MKGTLHKTYEKSVVRSTAYGIKEADERLDNKIEKMTRLHGDFISYKNSSSVLQPPDKKTLRSEDGPYKAPQFQVSRLEDPLKRIQPELLPTKFSKTTSVFDTKTVPFIG